MSNFDDRIETMIQKCNWMHEMAYWSQIEFDYGLIFIVNEQVWFSLERKALCMKNIVSMYHKFVGFVNNHRN